MEEGRLINNDKCKGCGHPLLKSEFSHSLCIVCNLSKLCLQCSIADIPMCNACANNQFKQITLIHTTTHIPCVLCASVFQTDECNECRKRLCTKCSSSLSLHPCLKCKIKDCKNGRVKSKDWCEPCKQRFEVAYAADECYECKICHSKAHPSAYEQNKCPIKNCQRKWGCLNCYVFRPEGLYCDLHISKNGCVLCLKRYPNHVGSGCGTIIAPEYNPQQRTTTYYSVLTCDRCMKKVRALIESIMILSKRKKERFEKGVMARILEAYLTGFY